jgi:CBS domain-containing protein
MCGSSIVPYCQAWNLQIAEEVQARLPVELRNFVYRYIWDHDTITLQYPGLQKVAGGSRSVDDGRSPLTLPHFIDPAFVGLATAREIVRALYDAYHAIEEPIVVRHPEHIKTVITKDVFGVGLDPGVHLKSLILQIKLDRYRTSRPQHQITSKCHHTKPRRHTHKRTA